MSQMKFKYSLDEIPPTRELLLFSLQWLAIAVPTILIIGNVVAGLHFDQPSLQINYVQKLFFVTAVALFVQIFWGHGMPIIIGPAAVLLVGVMASQGNSISSIYSSILVGGIFLFILSITGLFRHLLVFFTPRVIAAILILIAFTLTPMIMNLIIAPSKQAAPLSNLIFSLLFVICLFTANRFLAGIWKSTLIIWGIIVGAMSHFLIFQYTPVADTNGLSPIANVFSNLNTTFTLEPGVLISFLVCFIALSINDLGSIQSLGQMLQPQNMPKRIDRGISITGLANVLSGLLGVIGPVNFSLSPGVIASTGNASKFTLIPTSIILLILSFLPWTIAYIGNIPSVVIGSVLIYIMCSQISAGLLVAFNSIDGFKFENGLVLGLPLMFGIIIAFLPASVLGTFPVSLRPVLGNGFVIGVLSVMIMEHLIFKEKPV